MVASRSKSRSLLDKMRVIGFAQGRVVCKALVAESIEILGVGNTVVDDEPRHSTTAGLCPDSLDLQVVSLADIKQRLNNTNLLADTLPVEKMLEFWLSGFSRLLQLELIKNKV